MFTDIYWLFGQQRRPQEHLPQRDVLRHRNTLRVTASVDLVEILPRCASCSAAGMDGTSRCFSGARSWVAGCGSYKRSRMIKARTNEVLCT